MARGGDVRGLENSKKEVIVGRYAWFTLAILSSTLLTVFFSETMLLPAIPEIIKEFKIPYGTAAKPKPCIILAMSRNDILYAKPPATRPTM